MVVPSFSYMDEMNFAAWGCELATSLMGKPPRSSSGSCCLFYILLYPLQDLTYNGCVYSSCVQCDAPCLAIKWKDKYDAVVVDCQHSLLNENGSPSHFSLGPFQGGILAPMVIISPYSPPSLSLNASETWLFTKPNLKCLQDDRVMIRQICNIKPQDMATFFCFDA